MTAAPSRGWTLMELLIALALGALLGLLGVQAYQQQILHSRRALLTQLLVELATQQEDYRLRRQRYAVSLAELLQQPLDALYLGDQDQRSPVPTPQSRFVIRLQGDASGYRLQAESYGAQQADRACQRWSLDARGSRSAQGDAANPLRDCWP